MKKKWINWNENDLINESGADFVHSTKFKLLIFSFLIIFFLLINLRIIKKIYQIRKLNGLQLLKKVLPNSASFDEKKLLWLNGQYIRSTSNNKFQKDSINNIENQLGRK